MCGEKRQELGRPWRFLESVGDTDNEPQKGKPGNGSRPDPKRGNQVGYPAREGEGMPMPVRESDPLIVL